ncbi:UPF0711 protein C18orf21 homolog [Nelusetta ayraudi]|uniref:UPF0711 protein C18orf21 homolog n=1 Tax=Nelusetta ayraudi TaxID=303726 RepID=UPI003F71CCB1
MSPSRRPGDFLLNASQLYMDTCPGVSRYLMHRHVTTKAPVDRTGLLCPSCHQWLQPDNHRVRLRPKRRPSARLQLILRRSAAGKHLSTSESKLLRRFRASSSTLMATCHACNTTSRHKGMNRDFIASLAKTHSSTPGSAGKHKTPQSASRSSTSTSKTAGKNKTPSHTPRGSTSSTTSGSSSSSSKTPKAKNWVVRRLSKILMRDDSPAAKKGGLKDFLSSL